MQGVYLSGEQDRGPPRAGPARAAPEPSTGWTEKAWDSPSTYDHKLANQTAPVQLAGEVETRIPEELVHVVASR